jgi:AraC-like DNA-binding protein
MPAAYFRLSLRRFGDTPKRLCEIAEGTGIQPDDPALEAPDHEITLGQQLRQARNLMETGPPDWGLELGSALEAAAHGPLGVATASATSLAEALAVLERFGHVRAPYFRLVCVEADRGIQLQARPQLRVERPVWRSLVESLFMSIQGLIETSLGARMSDGGFQFDYPSPEYAERYADCLHARVSFDADVAAVLIPLDWLALACPFADRGLHRAAIDRLETAERRLQGEPYIVAQVARVLEGDERAPGLPEVASRLHVSERTLVRRLGRAGTSFRDLVDDHRRRRATELLADAGLNIAEVADRLGYKEPANFGRACRRWFGTGPRTLRERLRAEAHKANRSEA